MLAKYKKELDSTPTTIRQMLGPQETMVAVMKIITTARVGRGPREKELQEEAEEWEVRQDIQSEFLEGDDEEKNEKEE